MVRLTRVYEECGEKAIYVKDYYDKEFETSYLKYEEYSDSGYCAAEKLAEYEDLEEQGKLLRLPCAVGDTIYMIYSDEDSSFVEESKVVEVSTYRVWIDSAYFDYDDFGKTVFLTREEAEAALKELEGKKK